MAEFLIQNGANISVVDHAGATPLDYVEQRGHTKVADLLRSGSRKKNR